MAGSHWTRATHLRGARCVQCLPTAHGQTADVCRVEAINVLFQADGIQHPLLIDMGWQRQLHQDAVHVRIRIKICNNLGMADKGSEADMFQ
jgi:hypothetical protein